MMMANLYIFILKNGAVLQYTDAPDNLIIEGDTFFAAPTGPILERDKTRISLGLETSSMRIKASVPSNNSVMVGGFNWITAVRMGLFDGARVIVYRYIVPEFLNDIYGNAVYGWDYGITIFDGEVRDCNVSPLVSELNVISNAYKFDTALPLDNYAPSCVNQFGDSKCTFDRNSITVSSVAVMATDNYYVACNFALGPIPRARYLGGTVTFTSGNNNGSIRTIKDFEIDGVSGNVIKIFLTEPLLIPTTSEGFTLRQGCNKTYGRCTTLGNQANFRGFPYVPNPETIA